MRTWIHRRTHYACARLLCALLALFVLLPRVNARAAGADGVLRVKLARLGAPSQITMTANCDYHLSDDASVRIPAGETMTVSASGGALALTVGGHSLSLGSAATLARDGTGDRGLSFTAPALSNRFCGDLVLSASGDVITAVLRIYVEDYLYGVVGCEMPPSSAMAALEAQAVVSRNYALRQKAARSGSSYDLSDSGDALVFRGYNAASEYADAVRAVDATRGQVLYYGDKPATCYFCDSNGGQTESSANAFGTALPYSTVMDDPYDLNGAGTKKTALLRRDASDLAPALSDALAVGAARQLAAQGATVEPADIRIEAIEDIACESPRFAEPSRLYRDLAFTLSVSWGESGPARVTVRVPTYGGIEQWYDLGINGDDNETVAVARSDQGFEITFGRDGSGVGMSQRGAQVMAANGLSLETILDYYYPGTKLRTVDLSDSAPAGDPAAPERAAPTQPIATARLSQKTRLYESADTSSPAVTTLPAGATVAVYAVRGEWAAIGSGDLYGFIHAQALASFALVGVTAAQVRDETFARVGSGPVSVLQLPVKEALALATLSKGDLVRLDAYTDQWALVTTASGVEGFIPREALTLQSSASPADNGDIVVAQEGLYGLLVEDAGLYVNADDAIGPRGSLEKGSYVRILAYNSAWAYVRTDDDRSGYVKLECLSAVQSASQERQIPAEEGGEVTLVEGEHFLYVSASELSLFERCSTDSAVLATLTQGQRVRLGAYNDKWACVRVSGKTGFALRSGLADRLPEAEEADEEGGRVVVVKGTRYATVTGEDVPLYPARSEKDKPLSRLARGTRVQVGAYNDKWACVNAEGVIGFMHVTDLELGAAPEEDSGVEYRECDAVTTADVAMYADRDLSGAPVATVPKGESVHVYAFNKRCAYVDYGGRRGFIALRYLKRQ